MKIQSQTIKIKVFQSAHSFIYLELNHLPGLDPGQDLFHNTLFLKMQQEISYEMCWLNISSFFNVEIVTPL